MKHATSDLVEMLDEFPPFVVYALARKSNHGKATVAISLEEISSTSGLPIRSVTRLAAKLTFKDEKLSVINDFLRGCNFNINRTGEQRRYMKEHLRSKRGRFAHLSTMRWNIYVQKCAELEEMRKL